MSKVLIYIDSLKAGGAERVALLFGKWISAVGANVVVLTRKPLNIDFYPTPKGVTRRVEGSEPVWWKYLGWVAYLMRLRKLRHEVQVMNPDLVIALTTLPAIKMRMALWGTSYPFVISERNYPPAKKLSILWRILRRITYPTASLHIVQTRGIASWLVNKKLAVSVAVVANGIEWPIQRFSPFIDPKEFLCDNDKMLLAVGTKAIQKGFDWLVRAFGEVSHEFPQWRLVILGITQDEYHGINQQEELIGLLPAEHPAVTKIIFPGRAGNIADWYARADAFVLSSRYEGFPNVLLEAMACGKACIAVDCPTGPAELVDHNVNGLLLSMDEASLRSGMHTIMVDGELRARLAESASTVREGFSEQKQSKALIQALSPWLGE